MLCNRLFGVADARIWRMEDPPQTQVDRAARVKLGGAVRVSLLLDGPHCVRAKLHELSVSGGLLHLRQALKDGVHLEMAFHLPSGIVRASGETLRAEWATRGCLQAFRFIRLEEQDRESLQAALRNLLQPKV